MSSDTALVRAPSPPNNVQRDTTQTDGLIIADGSRHDLTRTPRQILQPYTLALRSPLVLGKVQILVLTHNEHNDVLLDRALTRNLSPTNTRQLSLDHFPSSYIHLSLNKQEAEGDPQDGEKIVSDTALEIVKRKLGPVSVGNMSVIRTICRTSMHDPTMPLIEAKVFIACRVHLPSQEMSLYNSLWLSESELNTVDTDTISIELGADDAFQLFTALQAWERPDKLNATREGIEAPPSTPGDSLVPFRTRQYSPRISSVRKSPRIVAGEFARQQGRSYGPSEIQLVVFFENHKDEMLLFCEDNDENEETPLAQLEHITHRRIYLQDYTNFDADTAIDALVEEIAIDELNHTASVANLAMLHITDTVASKIYGSRPKKTIVFLICRVHAYGAEVHTDGHVWYPKEYQSVMDLVSMFPDVDPGHLYIVRAGIQDWLEVSGFTGAGKIVQDDSDDEADLSGDTAYETDSDDTKAVNESKVGDVYTNNALVPFAKSRMPGTYPRENYHHLALPAEKIAGCRRKRKLRTVVRQRTDHKAQQLAWQDLKQGLLAE